MPSRSLIATSLVLVLSGCDQLPWNGQPDWALINKPKIQAAISDELRQRNPYPAELEADYKSQQQAYERTNQQISELKRASMQRCMSLRSGETTQREPAPRESASPLIAYSMGAAQANGAVHDCIQGIEKDQLIIDLKSKAQEFNQLQQRRREHDIQVQKIMDDTIVSAIQHYAQANGFRLIISNESSIAYNQHQQVLDVSNAIIEQIRQAPAAQ